jgi:hypothetical protein
MSKAIANLRAAQERVQAGRSARYRRADVILNTGKLIFAQLTAQLPIARTATRSHHATSFSFLCGTSSGSYSSTGELIS